MSKTSLVLVGVGGQGVLLVAKILGEAAMSSGLDVVQSEIHGMAQRGGNVESMLKIGTGELGSPFVGLGSADIVMAFEPLEAYRALPYIGKGTTVVTSVEKIIPFTVSIGREKYPPLEKVLDEVRSTAGEMYTLETYKLAKEAGDPITSNIVLLGAVTATGKLPLSEEAIREAMVRNVPSRFRELNERAFDLGYKAVKG